MIKYASRIEDLQFPVDIPKKGKGHKSVLANFSVGVSGYIQPEQFIPYFAPVANTVFLPSFLSTASTDISDKLNINSVESGVKFDLPMDRMSNVDFTDTNLVYTVGYQNEYSKIRQKSRDYLYVTMPAVVTTIVPTLSNLTFVLGYSGTAPYFEDIIFSMEKNIVPLTPAFTPEEQEELRNKLLASKNVYSIVTDILDIYTENLYIVSCDIELQYRSCVQKTNIFHTVEWKRK